MVFTAVASTMLSIEFLTPINNISIHPNITKAKHLVLENLRKDKDHIIVTADKGVALVVMNKTEYITKCETLPTRQLSLPTSLQKHISIYPQKY